MGLGRFRHVVVVIALWTIVAIVGSGADPDRSTWLGTSSLDTVVLVGLMIASAMGALFLIVLRPVGTREPQPRERRRSSLLMILTIALLLLVWRPDLLSRLQDAQEDDNATAATETTRDTDTAEGSANRQPVAELGDVIGLVAMAAAAGAIGWLLLRRGDPLDELEPLDSSPEHIAARLADAVDVARARVLSTDDPRAAVIAAYATLEQALADHGVPRRRPETPEEHLRRATTMLGAEPAPFAELGRLYSVARFSDREVSDQLRNQASAALERATTVLEVTP